MTRKRPRGTDEVKSLIELRHDDQRINVIAVVYSSTPATKAKGASHYVKFDLVDNTTSNIVTCLLFGALELLPDISTFSHPAVIRLRRFDVVMFQDRAQLQNTPGHSWCMFGRDTDSFRPEDKSHENTANSLTSAERDRITELRCWLRSESFNENVYERGPVYIPSQFIPESASSIVKQTGKFNKFSTGNLLLKYIENNLFFDLVAQVIGISFKTDCSIIRCIDGTKPSITTFKNNSLYIKTHFSQLIIAQLFDLYVDITVYDEHNIVAEAVEVGSFLEFKNLHCYIPSSSETSEVILHKGFQFGRGMRILPPGHNSIPPVQQRIDEIKVKNTTTWSPPSPPLYDEESPPITRLTYPDLPLSSIIDILETEKDSTSPSSLYRIRVFVDSYTPDNYPSFIRQFCGPCSSFSSSEQCGKCDAVCLNLELFFKLQIRDIQDGFEGEVKCFASAAREFLGVEEGGGLSMGRLEMVERVVGQWCDLGVICVKGALLLKGCSINVE